MAKDTRQIVRGVRVDGVVYKDGQEDELQAALKPERVSELVDNGTLEGDWAKPKAKTDAAK